MVRLAALGVLLLAAPLALAEPRGERIYRVGYLGSRADFPREAFRRQLRALGWVENQNIAIEYRIDDGRFDRLPAMAAELVNLKVDIIVSATTPATLAAKRATATIPIVLVAAADPVGSGIVESLARPGGNITGASTLAGLEIVAKRLELLKETVPNVTRIAALGNPTTPPEADAFRLLQAATQASRLTLQAVAVRELKDFEGAFAAITKARAEALLVLEGSLAIAHRRQIVSFVAKRRLPTIYGLREFVDEGGLMSYGVNVPDLYQRAAIYVDKILRGAKPGDLPVEQPTKFELLINMKAAKTLGLAIPPALLLRADQVIE